jgi:hypothetical protein
VRSFVPSRPPGTIGVLIERSSDPALMGRDSADADPVEDRPSTT